MIYTHQTELLFTHLTVRHYLIAISVTERKSQRDWALSLARARERDLDLIEDTCTSLRRNKVHPYSFSTCRRSVINYSRGIAKLTEYNTIASWKAQWSSGWHGWHENKYTAPRTALPPVSRYRERYTGRRAKTIVAKKRGRRTKIIRTENRAAFSRERGLASEMYRLHLFIGVVARLMKE